MNQLCNLGDMRLEEAQGIRIGHHHRGNGRALLTDNTLQVLQINLSVRVRLHLQDFQSADSSRGRIGAMRRIRDEDLGTQAVATALVIGTNNHQSRQLTMSTRTGIQRKLTKSRQFGQ